MRKYKLNQIEDMDNLVNGLSNMFIKTNDTIEKTDTDDEPDE